MKRRDFIASLGGAVIGWPVQLRAQPSANAARIGVLRPGALRDASLDAFLRGLRDLGYVESQNVLYGVPLC